jgi:predicted DsbA family dithiol-disulfide isomerase
LALLPAPFPQKTTSWRIAAWYPGCRPASRCRAWNSNAALLVGKDMQVEIWSDIVCPWCYIGKRRFERALASFEHADSVAVSYRSFELDPAVPASRSGSHAEHLARKYGMSVEQAEDLDQQMTERAAAEGLDFNFDVMRGGNTFNAHRLLHLAKERGVQLEMKERLMHATFTDGLPIADKSTLTDLAAEVGVPADDARDALEGDAYAIAVRRDEEQAAQHGITGVPFYVADGKFAVSGAQPTEVFQQLLHRAHEEIDPLTLVSPAGGDARSGGDSCAIG